MKHRGGATLGPVWSRAPTKSFTQLMGRGNLYVRLSIPIVKRTEDDDPNIKRRKANTVMKMPEQRSGFGVRDASPDSVIFTLESNFSLFSSASASVDRCSFASDAFDHDSEISPVPAESAFQNSAAHEHHVEESSSGTDRDPDPSRRLTFHTSSIKHSRLSTKAEKAKVQKEDTDSDLVLDSARSSFSLAIKECQDRRSRSEAFSKKLDRPRPASLDLNNASVSSPRLGNIKKSSMASRKSGISRVPKGWSSERVPAPTNVGRKNTTASMLPFNNGRTLPSKWEDAERWIFSPVQGDGVVRPSCQQTQRRPKSKSGPLGPPGVAYYSLYSPAMPMFDGTNVSNFMAASPFSAGVISADGLAFHSGAQNGAFTTRAEPCIARSVSVHGCSEVLDQQSSLPGSQVSRRDMATQMSPDDSTHSSPTGGPSYSASSSSGLPIVEVQSAPSLKLEVRDVQVDDRVTVTRWSKKHKSRVPGKGSDIIDNWKKKDADARSAAWDLSDSSKNISKVKREEAKITAWENLQKAKAEAAIRKLEMKLEKKRSSSMDKIMNKLRSAQKKAQDMRSSVLNDQAQVAGTSHRTVSIRITRQMGSLSGFASDGRDPNRRLGPKCLKKRVLSS
ncbi:Remorin family protein [Prunus dulcis]|uniref:Remorin family protein n=1 Tax=Prunus dulcis TaxID=3755 RepID=A0A4Y1QTP0_PRUDU|nr:Remorin family protein [Prunus dulcis]